MRTYVRTLLSMVILVGCGSQQTLPEQAQISVNPPEMLFRSDLGASFFVGVTPYGTDGVVITDEGQETLTISSVTLDDAEGVFSFLMPTPEGTHCDAGVPNCYINRPPDSAVVSLQFAPKAAKTYHATITITSDGANDGGTVVIPVTAVGALKLPDAG
jgi:hypothetical protein